MRTINQPAVRAHDALFPQWADRNLGDSRTVDMDGNKINITTTD